MLPQDLFSKRSLQIQPSATLRVAARAQQLKASGQDVISLGTGEPDFDTPEFIKKAAIAALERGATKYTAVEGIPSLRDAVIEKFKRDNALQFSRDEIMISTGCKQTIYNALQALLNPGDEVLIPAPYWVSYPDMTLLADARPIILETTAADHFKITPEQLERAITPRTRLLFLNSPSNPTGMAYRPDELRALGEVLERHPQVWILSDDIYEHIFWADFGFHNILMTTPSLRDRTIIANGVSKAYAMTGWRIGYCAAPKALIKIMTNIQSQSTSNPCSIAQAAAEAALLGDQSCIQTMCAAFKQRHDAILTRIRTIPYLATWPCDGAFYTFVNIDQALRPLGLADDLAFCEWLLQEALVALVPGSAFGAPGHVRLSFATSQGQLDEVLDRMAKVLS